MYSNEHHVALMLLIEACRCYCIIQNIKLTSPSLGVESVVFHQG